MHMSLRRSDAIEFPNPAERQPKLPSPRFKMFHTQLCPLLEPEVPVTIMVLSRIKYIVYLLPKVYSGYLSFGGQELLVS